MSDETDHLLGDFFVTAEERELIRGTDLVMGASAPEIEAVRELMAFWVADEEYAIAIDEVQEIIKVPRITSVPRVDPTVLGIISIRGTIVPLLDLRRVLRMPESEYSPQTRVLVLKGDGEPVGLLVDSVTSVIRLEAARIEATPVTLQKEVSDLIEGVGRFDDRMLIVLDSAAVMRVMERAA